MICTTGCTISQATLLRLGPFSSQCVADSWQGLHFSGALPTSYGTRRYLQLTEVAQIVHLLQDDTWMPRWDGLLWENVGAGRFRHWRPVLYTDERRFPLSTCDRPERVCRRCETLVLLPGTSWFACGSVMVWKGVFLGGSLRSRSYAEVPSLLLANRWAFFGPLPGHRVVQWVPSTSCGVSVSPLPGWWWGH